MYFLQFHFGLHATAELPFTQLKAFHFYPRYDRIAAWKYFVTLALPENRKTFKKFKD